MRRYPLAPLLDALGCDEATIKARLGLDCRQVARYVRDGLTEERADVLTTKAGYTPLELWPDWGLEPCPECGRLFAPTRKGHRFCRDSCRERRRLREKYRSDPAYAEAKRVARRAFYVECREYEKARERDRYWAQRRAA